MTTSTKESPAKACKECGGVGILLIRPDCCLEEFTEGQGRCVERCDSCGQFPSDLAAAQRLFLDASWYDCPLRGKRFHARGHQERPDLTPDMTRLLRQGKLG